MGYRTAIFFALFALIGQLAISAEEARWRAAAASMRITPETMMWMAGYASRTQPADGVTLDLHAKALVLEDHANGRLVIFTLDLIGVPKVMRDSLTSRIVKEHDIGAERVLINASHTHSGPELRAGRADLTDQPGQREAEAIAYTAEVEASLLAMVKDCLGRLQPVRLHYSYARCGFAMNRRTPLATGGYRNYPYPPGPVNHAVPVLKVTDRDKKELAILFGYNCHATTLALQEFNADYPGYAQKALEEAHPGAVALFMNGCSGDQNPYPRGKVELAEAHGKTLALAVETALSTNMQELTGTLRAAFEEIPLAYSRTPTEPQLLERSKSEKKTESAYASRLLNRMRQRGSLPSDYPYPVQVLRIGDQLTLVTLGGEVVVDYSLRLQQEIRDPIVWVAGYSNDVMTYIPSLRVLKEGGYEAGDAMFFTAHPAPWSEQVEEHIVGTVHRLRKSLE